LRAALTLGRAASAAQPTTGTSASNHSTALLCHHGPALAGPGRPPVVEAVPAEQGEQGEPAQDQLAPRLDDADPRPGAAALDDPGVGDGVPSAATTAAPRTEPSVRSTW
jgi:hypothetical protein